MDIYLIIFIVFMIFLLIKFLSFAYNKIISEKEKFPMYSFVSLLYPFSAGVFIYYYGAPLEVAFYYALSNLGYLLLIVGIISDKFLIFGLKTRMEVFIWAFIVWGTGTLFINLL